MAHTEFRILQDSRTLYGIKETLFCSDRTIQALYAQAQQVSAAINRKRPESAHLKASELYAAGIIRLIQREIITEFSRQLEIDIRDQLITAFKAHDVQIQRIEQLYDSYFPSSIQRNRPEAERLTVEEILLLEVSQENPALMKKMPDMLSSSVLKGYEEYLRSVKLIRNSIEDAPGFGSEDTDLFSYLCLPAKNSPNDLLGQLQFIMKNWTAHIHKYAQALLRAVDFIQEENRPYFPPGPGPTAAADFSDMETEYEAFSMDSDWMPNVLMMAKSTLVWLDQLSKEYNTQITRLDQIPDRELDLLAERGFSALWLIGLWQRSSASKRIKNACGNPDAEASAYSLFGYDIAEELGGWPALENLRHRCRIRGIRLASDMVPNHTGLDSSWMAERPDLFLQCDHSPFPSYSFEGEDLSCEPGYSIHLEDHYYDQTDAAVVFKRYDHGSGRTSYIYHGNDGTGMPWNDTAQLDYLNSETREKVIQTIIHVARNFPIIRFDAAMTLAKKHIQRLWYPLPGSGGDIPSRSAYGMEQDEFNRRIPVEFWREVVDRIAEEVPDTLLLAEAFWMMEGYFVRTLGMHRVYNSAFMNMLKNEENRKYRDTIKNTISFDPEILKRYVNFMNNPDEETAVTQFGDGDKYFGVCTLLVTMPGLPMFGHGQVEGFREKYGMEFRKSLWDEKPNKYLVGEHYRRIFPLMKKRYLFSNAENFAMYDFIEQQKTNENVFAYSNSSGDEKALILYNNCYSTAAGWIQRSAPSLKRESESNRELVSVDLHEALGLRGAKHDFVLFSGYHDGLTYVRSSSQLVKRGFYAALNGYGTQVFLDFREVEDSEGLYARLCEMMNGKGFSDLDREIRRLRFEGFHYAAREFYEEESIELVRRILRSDEQKDIDALKELLIPSYQRIEELWGDIPFDQDSRLPEELACEGAAALVSGIDLISRISTTRAESRYLDDALKIMPEIPALLVSWILARPIAVSYCESSDIGDIPSEMLFDDHFREPLRESTVPSEEADRILEASMILIKHQGWFTSMRAEGIDTSQMLGLLLEDPCIRSFVKVNWYQDTAWYHKESMQECFFWLYLAELTGSEKTDLQALEQLIHSWLKKEMYAQYRIDNLIS